MKNSLYLLIIAILTVGCHVTTSPTGTNTTSGSMTASVNGNSWSTVGLGSLVQTAKAVWSDSSRIVISGADLNLSTITLTVQNPSVKAFALGVTGDEGAFAYGTVPKDAYLSTTGMITITKYDTVNRKISGTFNFTGYQLGDTLTNFVEVKNGTFVDVGWSK